MRFYNQTHQHYAGFDLHVRNLYAYMVNAEGKTFAHPKAPTERDAFVRIVEPYQDDPVGACECLFCCYWLAGFCAEEDLAFVLGHEGRP